MVEQCHHVIHHLSDEGVSHSQTLEPLGTMHHRSWECAADSRLRKDHLEGRAQDARPFFLGQVCGRRWVFQGLEDGAGEAVEPVIAAQEAGANGLHPFANFAPQASSLCSLVPVHRHVDPRCLLPFVRSRQHHFH